MKGEPRNSHIIFVGIPSVLRPICIWEDNIKIEFKGVG
jgi:hypothetical protein